MKFRIKATYMRFSADHAFKMQMKIMAFVFHFQSRLKRSAKVSLFTSCCYYAWAGYKDFLFNKPSQRKRLLLLFFCRKHNCQKSFLVFYIRLLLFPSPLFLLLCCLNIGQHRTSLFLQNLFLFFSAQ